MQLFVMRWQVIKVTNTQCESLRQRRTCIIIRGQCSLRRPSHAGCSVIGRRFKRTMGE